MARVTKLVFVDDLTGDELSEDQCETVRWGMDGKRYEFDTTAERADEFRAGLEKWAQVSRVAGTNRKARTRVPATAPARVVREWCAQNDIDVPAKGRIPAEVREAFDAAH